MDIRCEMCFKAKTVGPAQPGLAVLVCKGCFLDIDRILGFLELSEARQGGMQSVLSDLGDSMPYKDAPPTPQPPTEPSENGLRPKKGTRTPVTS